MGLQSNLHNAAKLQDMCINQIWTISALISHASATTNFSGYLFITHLMVVVVAV
jgi:hypothetical protein